MALIWAAFFICSLVYFVSTSFTGIYCENSQ
jgi:hypothetical protein